MIWIAKCTKVIYFVIFRYDEFSDTNKSYLPLTETIRYIKQIKGIKDIIDRRKIRFFRTAMIKDAI